MLVGTTHLGSRQVRLRRFACTGDADEGFGAVVLSRSLGYRV
jgi:hypothetical protein